MNLLDLFVRVGVKDEASSEVEQLSSNMVGKLGSAAVNVGKALAGAFAVKKVVDFGKAAFDAYAQFEQLEGGVAKLYGNAGMEIDEYAKSVGKGVDEVTEEYQRNERAQKLMMENAQQAWKTAGMDANTYMEQATSFSASLINSLGGNTEEAAKLTQEAMVAMSDNVNTFGSDMGSVQNAFQGFAKQNYTMLDNLKLGYGGTQEEMKRLIEDASKMTKEQKDLNMTVDAGSTSFDNIVKAIQVVQKHQGIYGTTSREALTTIEGSMNATKAAWQNLVAEFGKEDGDIGARVSEMFTAVMGENGEGGLLKNVTKRVGVIAQSIVQNVGQGIVDGVRWMADNAPQAISETVESMGQWVVDNGPAIVEKLGEVWQTVLTWLGETWQNLMSFLIENGPQIVSTLAETGMQALAWLSEMLPQFVQSIGETLANIVNYIVEHREEILTAIGEAIQGIINAVVENGPVILQNVATAVGELLGYLVGAAGELLGGLLQSLKDHWPEIKDWFINLPHTILEALGDLGSLLLDAGRNLIGGFFKGLTEKFEDVKNWVGGVGEWIADHKGPKAYDRKLLDPNGQLIMKSLQNGLIKGLPAVEGTLRDITDTIQTGINTNVGVRAIQAPSSDSKVVELLTAILDKDQSVYLDSGRLVGGIAPQMNYAMGRL